MWTHGIKRIAGSTIVAAALLATALASHAQAASPCIAACHKVCRHDTTACVTEGNCGNMFGVCRTACLDSTMPGPDRQSCLADCRAERLGCRQDVASCKAECVQEFSDCKDTCNGE
jgi:hypothetical protein